MSTLLRVGFASFGVFAGIFSCLVSCQDSIPSDDGANSAALASIGIGNDGSRDCLFVADDPPGLGIDSEVDFYRYNPVTGTYTTYGGQFVQTGAGGFRSARTMVFDKRGGPNGDLIVVDQNAGLPTPSDILRFSSEGQFLGELVPATDPNAPFAARAAVIGKNFTMYVADVGDQSDGVPGRLPTFDARNGEFLGDLQPCADYEHDFFPRGVVIGPDGDLYVSTLYGETAAGGAVLRFDTKTGQCVKVVLTSEDCDCGFDRPEGLAFGPDGNLYVTSTGALTGIFIFDAQTGEQAKPPILTGASIVASFTFGPNGYLYAPIVAGAGTGQVRRYDVTTANYPFRIVVPAGSALTRPWSVTFCNTDSATRAYEPRGNTCCPSP